jgi:hypothetical protein
MRDAHAYLVLVVTGIASKLTSSIGGEKTGQNCSVSDWTYVCGTTLIGNDQLWLDQTKVLVEADWTFPWQQEYLG